MKLELFSNASNNTCDFSAWKKYLQLSLPCTLRDFKNTQLYNVKECIKTAMLQSEGHSWSKLILEDRARSFPTRLHQEKAGIDWERCVFHYENTRVYQTFHHSYDDVQAACLLKQQVQHKVNLRGGFGLEAVDPRAIIHSGALLQPLHISFLLCCSCHALWNVATGLSSSSSSRSTFSCCIHGNTGFIISLSHRNREQMDSSNRAIMLWRCHHTWSHKC